nr:hypothetical protein [Psychrobacter sp. PraFG1]UNK05449.1 hypothetical protein MN210_00360 [Psychrobacter sp. PraFG1]
MARLILTCNTLSADHDSVCRLISTPEVGGFTATGDKKPQHYGAEIFYGLLIIGLTVLKPSH